METNRVIEELRKKYMCKQHPTDKRAVVVYNVSLKELGKITAKLRCSGHYNEEECIGVITNFGKY